MTIGTISNSSQRREQSDGLVVLNELGSPAPTTLTKVLCSYHLIDLMMYSARKSWPLLPSGALTVWMVKSMRYVASRTARETKYVLYPDNTAEIPIKMGYGIDQTNRTR